MSINTLIEKYDRPGPRYTSYPPVPFWNGTPSTNHWLEHIKTNYTHSEGIDLYIHIPYCEILCYYCGCNRMITKDKSLGSTYVDLLIKEWRLYLSKLEIPLKISSLHFGGGTPTFLEPEVMDILLSELAPNFSKNFMGSIEVDPRTCKTGHLEVLKKHGFQRISMGIQDFDKKVQESINRTQSYDLVKGLVEKIREFEFSSVNFDLIYGLPYQTKESIIDSITKVTKLDPDMIAFYSYAHLPDRIKNQKLVPEEALPTGKEKRALYNTGRDLLIEKKFHEIGLDHFAKDDSYLTKVHKEKKLLRNFMGYTDKKTKVMIGLGLTSISNSSLSFAQNHKEIKEYTDAILNNQIPLNHGHTHSEEDLVLEDLIQNLMCNGIGQISKAKTFFDDETWLEMQGEIQDMQKDGLLELNKDEILVSEVGQIFLRNIAMIFDPNIRRKTHKTKFSQTI